jgi:16S rRNA (guanine527-N7)-methyltransferase
MSLLADTLRRLLNLTLTPSQVSAFECYSDSLREWNERMNLTAIIDPVEIEMRHFADSLSCLLAIKPTPGLKVIDVGTGAGFPGLPLKIVYPSLDVTLVEATGKKLTFLEHVIGELKLDGVRLVNERAETIGQMAEHRERYDWALARAVARMPVLAEYLLPLCKIGGHALAQKGESAHTETSEASPALRLLGGRLTQITPVELPTVAETHYLVDIEKIAATPPLYPRRPGLPGKKPL